MADWCLQECGEEPDFKGLGILSLLGNLEPERSEHCGRLALNQTKGPGGWRVSLR